MKARETKIIEFLNGPKHFLVPIYQRTYSWTTEQCGQLWSDIIRAGNERNVTGHFVGSIVYIEKGLYQATAIPELLVIDGQQRLTTLTLLIAAFREESEKRGAGGDIGHKKLNNYYLVNSEETGDQKYKLLLTQNDRQTLMSVIDRTPFPKDYSQRISQNYDYFKKNFSNPDLDLNIVHSGIAKLHIVDISLDRQQDNPQLIFESLNSTGLELSQADLIRNFILMGLESADQERVYKEYWRKMEELFGQAEYADHFDRFMRDYLTVKLRKIPNIKEVYREFKYYYLRDNSNVSDAVADIFNNALLYVRLALGREVDQELHAVFEDIRELKVDVAYPFLLELLNDYEIGLIDKETLVFIARTIESYVFRRTICGIPTNSLNKTFANLMKEIDKGSYRESFIAALLLKDSYRRYPSDEEFLGQFVTKDVYSIRIRNYLLRKLENSGSKERVDVTGLTIEHVMPQNENLSDRWKAMLGHDWESVQNTYLHTIGNLTLTAYNPELSDRPFEEKRDMANGFKVSPLRLNRSLASLDSWTEKEIRNRADKLAEEARNIWSYPEISAESLEKYRPKNVERPAYTMEQYEYLSDGMKVLFDELRKRIMNLDPAVTEDFTKKYIAYKLETNFVDIVPQKSRLKLILNISINEIDDPSKICRDVSKIGVWGNGDTETSINDISQIGVVMALITQAMERQV